MRGPKYPVKLSEEERIGLERIVKNPMTAQQTVQRAQIILLAAMGMKHQDIAAELATCLNVGDGLVVDFPDTQARHGWSSCCLT